MRTSNYLEHLIGQKRFEVERLLEEFEADPHHRLKAILEKPHASGTHFSSALKRKGLAMIAEVKRRSPTRGMIGEIDAPEKLALSYCEGGASAISVLTDAAGFGGSLTDLERVSSALHASHSTVSVLRKDFILHPVQLAEAAASGAQAVLLIVHVVGKELGSLLSEAKCLGLEVLTEVHDLADLELALECHAPIIGINHRNLRTFEIDLGISEVLKPLIPSHIITVAESGIHQPEQAKRMRELGFDAVLVGEALVRSTDPSKLIKSMIGACNDR